MKTRLAYWLRDRPRPIVGEWGDRTPDQARHDARLMLGGLSIEVRYEMDGTPAWYVLRSSEIQMIEVEVQK